MGLLTLFCSMNLRERTEGKYFNKASTCSYFWVSTEAVSLQLKELSLLHPATSTLCKPATDSRLLSYPEVYSCYVFYSLKLLSRKCTILHLSYRMISTPWKKPPISTTIPYTFSHLHLLEFSLGNSRSFCIGSYALSWIFLAVYVHMSICLLLGCPQCHSWNSCCYFTITHPRFTGQRIPPQNHKDILISIQLFLNFNYKISMLHCFLNFFFCNKLQREVFVFLVHSLPHVWGHSLELSSIRTYPISFNQGKL